MGPMITLPKPLYPDEILNTITKAIETHIALLKISGPVSNDKSSRESKKQVFANEL